MKIKSPQEKKNPLGMILLILLAGFGVFVYFFLNSFFKSGPVPSLIVQSFIGKVEISADVQKWRPAQRGSDSLKGNEWLQTGADGEIDLKFGETAYLRVKKNSRIKLAHATTSSSAIARVHVEKGSLLVSNPNEPLQVSVNANSMFAPEGFFQNITTSFIEAPQGGIYLVSVAPGKQAFLNVVRGKIKIISGFPPQTVVQSKELESIQIRENEYTKKTMEAVQWREVQEGYELAPKSLTQEAKQLDLSKKSGNFFDFVFDHGTFYQPKWGWCERQFIHPQDNGPVYLEATYDVFPVGAWVGLYLKTRDLDVSKYKKFSVEARKIPGQPHPDFIRIEFKAKSQVVQAFAIKKVSNDWEKIDFPIRVSRSALVSEVTFIFSHDKVGSQKSGGVQFRNFNLDEKPAAEILEQQKAETPAIKPPETASKTPVVVGKNKSAITKDSEEAPLEKLEEELEEASTEPF